MNYAFKLSPVAIFAAIVFVAAGELAAGTSPFFATMVSFTLLCIALAYNTLGGLTTLSGIVFTGFAVSTIVISQFAKVFLFEPANQNLQMPLLTIEVYALFFFCAMLGIFVFGRVRFDLPKPSEPDTTVQVSVMYAIAVTVGIVATAVNDSYTVLLNPQQTQHTLVKSIALGFSNLLLFSIVLGVEERLRRTNGQHSFGMKVLIPAVAMTFFGFVDTARGELVTAVVVYVLTCYVRGYRFRRKHYLSLLLATAAFYFLVSPIAIYLRSLMGGMTFKERVYESFYLTATLPNWTAVEAATQRAAESGEAMTEYYNARGTFILSRLSLIRPDSNLISACASGFRYGFKPLLNDLELIVPRAIDPHKPDEDSAGYIGSLAGENPDTVVNGEATFTAVSDSFAGWGWIGVMVVGLIVFPAPLVIYESMFDMRRPWGTVAFGMLFQGFRETDVSGLVANVLRMPFEILLLSYFIAAIVKMVPVRGAQLTGQAASAA